MKRLALLLLAAPLSWGQGYTMPGGGASSADVVGTTSVSAAGACGTANSVCITANTITGEGATADGFETLFAFGDATADQTLTCTGAASSLGCVVASPAVPVNGATAGNALAFTASPAIPNAGAGTDGAAAGGPMTFTTGAAARDTSGNADGGDFIFVGGAGIGTGLAGTIQAPDGNNTTNPGLHGTDVDTGFGFAAGEWYGVANATLVTTTTSAGVTYAAAKQLQMQGIIRGGLADVETVATTKSPNALEANEIYTNGADVDGQAITLLDNPTAGVCYEFALTSTNSSGAFVIAPSAGETLRDAGTSCATVFSATALGATCRICAVSGGSGALWFVMSKTGTWTCTP